MASSPVTPNHRTVRLISWFGIVLFMKAMLMATIEVGQPFPVLVLPSLHDGAPLSMADFQGSKTVLHNFASW